MNAMPRKIFFRKLYFEIALAIFFIFLATSHYPGNGFDFITLFCCLFATTNIVTSINMLRTYNELKKLANIMDNFQTDDDSLDDKDSEEKH